MSNGITDEAKRQDALKKAEKAEKAAKAAKKKLVALEAKQAEAVKKGDELAAKMKQNEIERKRQAENQSPNKEDDGWIEPAGKSKTVRNDKKKMKQKTDEE